MINTKILFIVEGARDEKTVFEEIFKKYGYKVITCEKRLLIEEFEQDFDTFNFEDGCGNLVLIEGPRNRIHGFLKYVYENSGQFEKVFQKCAEPFSGVFLIYDVDHNDEDDINKMFKKYNDETDGGLLLLNSPCFETITGSHELIYNKEIGHLTEYKTELNKSFSEKHNCSACEFIKNNFNSLVIQFLDKNVEELQSTNVMEHPQLIIEKINKHNIRKNFFDKDKSFVQYRYFTTVIYTAIAYAHGLTRQFDNYTEVRRFFEQYLERDPKSIEIDKFDLE